MVFGISVRKMLSKARVLERRGLHRGHRELGSAIAIEQSPAPPPFPIPTSEWSCPVRSYHRLIGSRAAQFDVRPHPIPHTR